MTSEHRYQSAADLMASVDAAIGAIPQCDWAAVITHYKARLCEFIAAGGRYFERE